MLRSFFVLLCGLQLYADSITVYPGSIAGALRDAVAKAKPNSTIIVTEGYYREGTVVVDKPLTLTGRGKVRVVANGQKDLLLIKADGVHISGLTFEDVYRSFISDNAAIKIDSAKSCIVEYNSFSNNFFGIYLSRAENCQIRNNTIEGKGLKEASSGNGIHLWYCRNITVTNNQIFGHRDGIYLEFCRQINVSGNNSKNNLRYGLHFMFSDSCLYTKNIFAQNGAGVAVMYSKHIDMYKNTFERNCGTASFGLLLKDIKDSKVRLNTIRSNTSGIFMEAALRISLSENKIINNGWAIKLMGNSDQNTFQNNNFIGNTFDVTTNTRRDGNYFARNYWDNYSGYDLDRDGLGDVPYRPVSLYSVMVAENPVLLVLLKSMLINILDTAERIAPALTPDNLKDLSPSMKPYK